MGVEKGIDDRAMNCGRTPARERQEEDFTHQFRGHAVKQECADAPGFEGPRVCVEHCNA
jgi:hypothetical protein